MIKNSNNNNNKTNNNNKKNKKIKTRTKMYIVFKTRYFYFTEETCITTAAYEPELEDEIKLEKGKIVKVIQKNLDGWWLVK